MGGCGAGEALGEVATLHSEGALLQVPLAIVARQGELLGLGYKITNNAKNLYSFIIF